MSELPVEYDTIIIGTGLTESILSAALSRVGKTVLHIDKNDYYGSEYSSFTLKNLIEYANNQNKIEENQTEDQLSKLFEANLSKRFYSNSFEYKWNLNESEIENFLNKNNRKFVIDLQPNLFYSQSKLINLLIKSDVAKYCEFKLIKKLLTCSFNDDNKFVGLEQVPSSRSDIFKATNLTMIEKRLLMKFITSCVNENESAAAVVPQSATMDSYLETFKLTKRLNNYILNAIAMCPPNLNANDGLKRCERYFKSIGRYGDTPFLYQIYGTNELTQAFSRLSAVFGAIFYLNLEISSFKYENDSIDGVFIDLPNEKNKLFKCKNLITNLNYLNYEIDGSRFDISKCVLITNKSIFSNDEAGDDEARNEIAFLYLPESSKSSEIFIIEASSTAQVCPSGYYLVYMFCEKKNEKAKDDFEEAINYLYSTNEEITRDNIIFELYYSQLDTHKTKLKFKTNPINLFHPTAPTNNLDFDLNVDEAEEIFKKIYPNDEFLPKPPDPEDIIFGDEGESSKAEQQSTQKVEGNNQNQPE